MTAAETTELAGPERFQTMVEGAANRQLSDIIGTERGQMAAKRISAAFLSAVASAKDPSALMRCSGESIAECMALSYHTGLYPGGPHPLVYLIPKAKRLQWWVTHRGLGQLSLEAGFMLSPIPVTTDDDVRIEFGEAVEHRADPSAWAKKLDDLQGVIVTVRRADTGAVLMRPWMPIAAIIERSNLKGTNKVWGPWPIPQALKTAIKYHFARGTIPAYTEKLSRALTADSVFDDQSEPDAPESPPVGRVAIGGDASDDHSSPVDALPPDPFGETTITETLDAVHEHGGHAWDNVEDPDAAVQEMRGNELGAVSVDLFEKPDACPECGAVIGTPHAKGCSIGEDER